MRAMGREVPVTTIPTAEFLRNFGRYHDEAQREPVTLTKHGRPSAVLVSADLYAKLTADRSDPRRVYRTEETPPELARLILSEIERLEAEFKANPDE
jgi:prevent-host-death family protein